MHGRLCDYMVAPTELDKERRKNPGPARFLLTGRFGGCDQTLPPSVWSIPERSKSPGIAIGRVRSQLTGRSQSPVQAVSFVFNRPDTGSPFDQTLNSRVRSLLCSKFTSCELTGCWTSESGATSDHSFSSKIFKVLRAACSQSSPNFNKNQINTN